MGQKSFKTYFAFTMAEVLITLGIIGVVASITLPALVQNYQKHVLKNQYKKAYANFYNAIKLTQAKLDYPLGCSYWEKKYLRRWRNLRQMASGLQQLHTLDNA